MPIHIMAKVILVPCSVNETVERDNASRVEVPINNATTVPIQRDYAMTDRCTIVVPRLFEEKRRDIVFGFPSFRLSVRPSVLPSFRPPIEYVRCVRNSSYSFTPILLKLYRCLYHPFKICMWFGYNPQINFSLFFRNLNLVIFRAF